MRIDSGPPHGTGSHIFALSIARICFDGTSESVGRKKDYARLVVRMLYQTSAPSMANIRYELVARKADVQHPIHRFNPVFGRVFMFKRAEKIVRTRGVACAVAAAIFVDCIYFNIQRCSMGKKCRVNHIRNLKG